MILRELRAPRVMPRQVPYEAEALLQEDGGARAREILLLDNGAMVEGMRHVKVGPCSDERRPWEDSSLCRLQDGVSEGRRVKNGVSRLGRPGRVFIISRGTVADDEGIASPDK